MYKQNRLPCHDHANRRRFLKTLTFTEPEAIERKIPLIFASGRYDKCVILLIFTLNLYAPESYFFSKWKNFMIFTGMLRILTFDPY
jgi:hypothetical protein